MTKLKICSKIHLFIIISVLFIAIGMAVGSVCHFIAGGFFNYGGEFSSYKSITVTYYSSEYTEETVAPVIDSALGSLSPYEKSFGETTQGGEVVYKFSSSTDSTALENAVASINTSFEGKLSCASWHEGIVNEGGAKNLVRAAIAFASAAAFQFLYYICRYKLRAAFSALLSCVHNVGIYAALLAVTRIPVGTEAVAVGSVVLFMSMVLCGLLFDRTRKNFKSEQYAKSERVEVIEISASEVRVLSLALVASIAVGAVILGVCSAIASLSALALAACAVGVFAALACGYGCLFFTPAVHSAIDSTCEKVLLKAKQKAAAKPDKAKNEHKPEISEVKKEDVSAEKTV